MFRVKSVVTVLAVVALGGSLAACGDDGAAPATTVAPTTTAAPTTTTESLADFGARVQADCPGGEPGFDEFLAAHPEPTAADWAGFLPQPRAMLTDLRACIAASNPPVELHDEVDGVLAAMDVVIADLAGALAAAEAGDLEGVDARLTEMNSGHVEAIDTATQAVMAVIAAG